MEIVKSKISHKSIIYLYKTDNKWYTDVQEYLQYYFSASLQLSL